MHSEQQILDIKRKHSAKLRAMPGVSGVGIEKDAGGAYVLAVHLDSTQPDAGRAIPNVIDGVKVVRHTSGPFLKQRAAAPAGIPPEDP